MEHLLGSSVSSKICQTLPVCQILGKRMKKEQISKNAQLGKPLFFHLYCTFFWAYFGGSRYAWAPEKNSTVLPRSSALIHVSKEWAFTGELETLGPFSHQNLRKHRKHGLWNKLLLLFWSWFLSIPWSFSLVSLDMELGGSSRKWQHVSRKGAFWTKPRKILAGHVSIHTSYPLIIHS